MSTASQSLLGKTIADRYHVLELLGEGGMGRVYLAEHVLMGRKSAVKVLSPELTSNAEAISRFHREAANASRISHPNVAAIYDFGDTGEGLLYLAMEFVEGETLRAMLTRTPRIDLLRAVKLIEQAADALAAAHHLGLVHRDIKPDNIMVTRNLDGTELVKVVDFGIAKTVDERHGSQTLTTVGVSIGTPEYMSPEQLAGEKLDARTDVYSLALVLFHMLTGGMPFPRLTSRETLVKRLSAEPRRLDEIAPDVEWPVKLQRALDRALAPDVERRYSSVGDFGRDVVEAAQSHHTDRAARLASMPRGIEQTAEPPTKPMRRSGSRVATAALIVLLAAAALLFRAQPVGIGIIHVPATRTRGVSTDSALRRDAARSHDSSAAPDESSRPVTVEARQPDTTHHATGDSTARHTATDSKQAKRDSIVAPPTPAAPAAGAAESRSAAAAAAVPAARQAAGAAAGTESHPATTAPATDRSAPDAPADSGTRARSAQNPPDSAIRERAAAPTAPDSSLPQPRAHRLLRSNGDTADALGAVPRGDSTRAAVEDVRGHFEKARQLLVAGRPGEAQLEFADAFIELRLLRGRLDAFGRGDLDMTVRRLREQAYQTCVDARDRATERDAAARYQCDRVLNGPSSGARRE